MVISKFQRAVNVEIKSMIVKQERDIVMKMKLVVWNVTDIQFVTNLPQLQVKWLNAYVVMKCAWKVNIVKLNCQMPIQMHIVQMNLEVPINFIIFEFKICLTSEIMKTWFCVLGLFFPLNWGDWGVGSRLPQQFEPVVGGTIWELFSGGGGRKSKKIVIKNSPNSAVKISDVPPPPKSLTRFSE